MHSLPILHVDVGSVVTAGLLMADAAYRDGDIVLLMLSCVQPLQGGSNGALYWLRLQCLLHQP